MTKYLYFQSIVQYRIPLKGDGTAGTPEITKKFTSPVLGSQNFKKAKKVVKETGVKVEDTVYM